MNFMINFLKGISIGIANLVPGISGGTIAVILGVYDKIIFALNGIKTREKGNLMFLLSIVFGVIVGFFAFSSVIKYLILNFPLELNLTLAGFVLGGIPMIYKLGKGTKHSRTSGFSAFIFSMALVVVLGYMSEGSIETEPLRNIGTALGINLFFVGIIAGFAMVLPGISGSMLLLVIGQYSTYIHAISERNIPIILIIGSGALLGIFLGVKAISIALKRFTEITYRAILGLIVGSLYIMTAPYINHNLINDWKAVTFMGVGAILSFVIAKRKKEYDK